MSVDNHSSSLKPGKFAKAWMLSLLFACQAANPSFSIALAASSAQVKPPLKAIDSSYAKMDPIPKGVAPGGIQSGSVNGAAPISGNQSAGLPAGGYSPLQYQAQGYGQQGYQPSYPQPGQYQGTPGYAGQSYPSQPPAYPGYQNQNQYGGAPQYSSTPQYGAPQQQYGQLPQYGGGYGGAPPVQAPPGYPQMQPQYGSANQLPPGFVPSGTQQQQQPQNSFPAGRARLGGGHPNLVPQGAPPAAGPGPTGFAGQGSYPQMNTAQPNYGGGYPQGGYQQPAPGAYGQAPGGYSQPAGYTAGGATAQQFAQTNFPSPNMIPEFGKPLPTDATNKGPAGMWATNQMYTYGGAAGYGGNGTYGDSAGGNYGPSGAVGSAPSSGANSQDEARVARLEKVAFGSTYPEHEVEDRVDHLEKEIFGEKSSGDMNSRLQRLEVKLGGSSGSFGSPRSYGGPPAVGSQSLAAASGSLPASPRSLSASPGSLAARPVSPEPQSQGLTARAASLSATAGGLSADAGSLSEPNSGARGPAKAVIAKNSHVNQRSVPPTSGKKLALKQPGDEPQQTSPPEAAAADCEGDDDAAAPMSDDDDDSGAASGNSSSTGDSDSDGDSSPPSDTTDGAALPSSTSNKSVAGPPLKIPFEKGAGDYMNRITTFVNNTTAHWTHFPVRVRLPEDASPEWRKLMEPGVEKWSRYVPLKTANRKESADIEVTFVNHLVPRVLGVTRLTVASGQMKVFIYMLRPSYYPQLPEKTLAGAFVHELGHAIGIFGHSDKPTDAMYTCEVSPSGRGKITQEKLGAISSRDINTLKLIYDAEPLPADFNLSAPEEWSLCSGSESNS